METPLPAIVADEIAGSGIVTTDVDCDTWLSVYPLSVLFVTNGPNDIVSYNTNFLIIGLGFPGEAVTNVFITNAL